jgi:predicted permease
MSNEPFLLQSLLPIFAYFFIGLTLRQRGIASAENADFLFRIVFLVTLPALVFTSVSQADLSRETALLPVGGFLVNAVCAAAAVMMSRARGLHAADTGAVVVSAGIMNMGYTFPFILATLGQAALADAILFDVGNALFVAFCIYPLAEWFGHRKAGFSMVSVRRVMLSPIFIAIVLALSVNLLQFDPGEMVRSTLSPLGRATVPLMLIAVGMSFGGLAAQVPEAFLAIAARMLFGVIVGALLVLAFGFEGLTAAVVIVSAAAPVGASAAAVASVAGLSRGVAVNAVAISALIGLLSTSALLFATSRWFG